MPFLGSLFPERGLHTMKAVFRSFPPVVLSLALANSVGSLPAVAADTVDLRNGARTVFYGGGYDASPPRSDFYGWAIAFGDIDGDGIDDFISSSTNSEGPNDAYEPEHDVYVFFGRARSDIDSLYPVDEPDVADIVIYRGGHAIACGDLDADGYDDIILAEHRGYVIFGGPREQLRRAYDFVETSANYTPPDVSILGSFLIGGWTDQPVRVSNEGVSYGLVSGDLNDDGFGDIVVGDAMANTGRTSGGAAFIIFGRPREAFPTTIDTDPMSSLPHPDVMIVGKSSDLYPFHLAVGDFDGDRVDDLVAMTVRGLGDEVIVPWAGELHGFFGKRTWKALYDMQTEEFDFSFTGYTLPGVGYRLAAGDLDGDGRDELITASVRTEFDPTRNTAGEYRIYFGRPRGMWPRWGRVEEWTDVLIVGASIHDVNDTNPSAWWYPISIATGRHDPDIYEDLAIGAGLADGPAELRNGAGEVYLIRGRPRGLWQPFMDLRYDYDLIVYGADGITSPGYQFDLLGFTTAFGDIDGSGTQDLFMSALHADGPGNFAPDIGEIHVLYGTDSTIVAAGPRARPTLHSAMLPCYPNPFHGTLSIPFTAPAGERVELTVYDVRGRVVARPLPSSINPGIERIVQWRAVDDRGFALPAGIYFVRLVSGVEKYAQKVLLVH
jgi:hypothetical protein